MIFLGPCPAAGPKKFALAASGCIKISLALTWIPLKNIKEEIKKNKNNNIKTRIGKRETRGGI
jgi:hypothetical protein